MQRSNQAGITLIELVAALGISALIISLVVFAHQSLTSNTRRMISKADEQALAASTVDLLARELEQLFHPAGESACAIELENSATNLVSLRFCRWTPRTPPPHLPTNHLDEIIFTYARVDEQNQLVQLVRPVTGPGAEAPATNWPGRTWPSLMVHFHDGSAWITNWPASKAQTPVAARILLFKHQQPAQETMVIIPAGLSVTSRVQRLDGT